MFAGTGLSGTSQAMPGLRPVELASGKLVYAQVSGLSGFSGLTGLGEIVKMRHPRFGTIPVWVPLSGLGLLPLATAATAGKALTTLTNQYHQDNQFIKYRDNVMKALTDGGFPISDWEGLFGKYKLAHKDIPDRKLSDYGPEFARLHDFVREYLNSKKAGLGDFFYNKSWEMAQSYIAADPARSYKGSPHEALVYVLANRNNIPASATTSTPAAASGGTTIPVPGDQGNNNLKATGDTKNLLIMGGIAAGVLGLMAVSGAFKKAA
jgi:hypothetical protein